MPSTGVFLLALTEPPSQKCADGQSKITVTCAGCSRFPLLWHFWLGSLFCFYLRFYISSSLKILGHFYPMYLTLPYKDPKAKNIFWASFILTYSLSTHVSLVKAGSIHMSDAFVICYILQRQEKYNQLSVLRTQPSFLLIASSFSGILGSQQTPEFKAISLHLLSTISISLPRRQYGRRVLTKAILRENRKDA